MSTSNSIRICILGHSGIGKSPLAKLFEVEGWEPYRVRKPRNDADKLVCMSEKEYDNLIKEHQELKPLFKSSKENDIRVYKDWSFFKVRNEQQCLKHTEISKDPSKSIRVEIFAPVLLEMIENISSLGNAFSLNNLFFIFLNPTSESFVKMRKPSTELKLATHTAIVERYRAQGKIIDLADVSKRIKYLDDELKAWQEIIRIPSRYIECMKWSHFEYRYSANNLSISDSKEELIQARDTIINNIKTNNLDLLDCIESIMLSPDKIVKLDKII
ncbi:MAG: hypothetical protein WCA84_05090 [Ignavibacteriaceae bacterium]